MVNLTIHSLWWCFSNIFIIWYPVWMPLPCLSQRQWVNFLCCYLWVANVLEGWQVLSYSLHRELSVYQKTFCCAILVNNANSVAVICQRLVPKPRITCPWLTPQLGCLKAKCLVGISALGSGSTSNNSNESLISSTIFVHVNCAE